jgi:(E)-4-hydroxy-3-methylbut-2-enyl-diphosphate synthase
MARDVERFLRERMPEWRLLYPGVEDLRVAVMGCVVNGPGESRHADVGISLPGAGEDPKAPVYVEGRLSTVLKGPGLVPEFLELLERYVASRYGA